MRITTIRSEGLAALSYFVSSENEAMVIDPRRDASIYERLAQDYGTKITHIFETHRNEDYVIGSLELQSIYPDAEIGHSKATKFGYGDINIADGEAFQIGKMRVTCLNTPGHTDDSMCYIVADSSVGPEPIVAFTGDTLFVNEVGRTDLVDIFKHDLMSKKLYKSLHEILLPLGDGIVIHPGHGAGSVCGGDIGEREFSTIGFEKKNNAWLQMEEDEFIQTKVDQRLTRATYFKRCEKLNTDGPPLLSTLEPPQELDIDEFEIFVQHPDNRVIDTRPKASFIESYVPGTISMSMKNIGLLAGWVLRPEHNFSFILRDPVDIKEARAALLRVGLDNVVGYLRNGFLEWQEHRRPVESISSISVEDLNVGLKDNTISIIDVREPHEYEKERIAKSIPSPLTRMEEDASCISASKKIATVCPSGFRSTTAASIMKRNGIDDVVVLLTGLKEWKEKGYPLEE